MKIVPFLEGIFRLERDGKPDAYIWVDTEDNRVRVTSFYGVASMFTHDPEPMSVASEENEEKIERALGILKNYPKEELAEMFERFEQNTKAKQQNEDDWKEYCEWEKYAKDMVEEAKRNGTREVMF